MQITRLESELVLFIPPFSPITFMLPILAPGKKTQFDRTIPLMKISRILRRVLKKKGAMFLSNLHAIQK